jgi:hypothetical protein
MATTLACQAIQHAVGTMAQSRGAAEADLAPDASPAPTRPNALAEAAPRELRALSNIEVLSTVPGRARLRIQGVRDDAERAVQVVCTVRALDGVASAEANPLTGTLLVRFDPAQIDVPRIVAALEPPVVARPVRASERAPYLRLVVG